MNGASAVFLQWGVIQISLANCIVIAVMVVLFVLALTLPFPHGRDIPAEQGSHDELR